MSRHAIKFEYEEGVKLDKPILWCKKKYNPHQFYFQDAQHLALSVGGSIQPCKNCIKAIIKTLSEEL
jgi:hypothetical protein